VNANISTRHFITVWRNNQIYTTASEKPFQNERNILCISDDKEQLVAKEG
jgi:hypothetical protein